MSPSDSTLQLDILLKQVASVICMPDDSAALVSPEKWPQILDIANKHCVLLQLYQHLVTGEHWSSLPDPVREQLNNQNRAHVAGELRQHLEIVSVLNVLHSVGIQYLLMKGTALAYSYYPEPHLRVRADTDILFPDRETAERAWLELEKLGYSRNATTVGDFVGYQFYCLREISPGIHSNFDCHNKINDYLFYAHAFEFEELFEASVSIPEITDSARGLGPIHALMLTCMHRVASLPSKQIDRLSWMYDIYLLTASFTDDQWQEFVRLCNEKKISATCYPTIQRALSFFPLNVPENMLKSLEAAAATEPFQPDAKMKKWQFYWASLRSLPSVRSKFSMVREHLFPSVDYMLHKYQSQNRWLLPWFYIHRVFSGVGRYF